MVQLLTGRDAFGPLIYVILKPHSLHLHGLLLPLWVWDPGPSLFLHCPGVHENFPLLVLPFTGYMTNNQKNPVLPLKPYTRQFTKYLISEISFTLNQH